LLVQEAAMVVLLQDLQVGMPAQHAALLAMVSLAVLGPEKIARLAV